MAYNRLQKSSISSFPVQRKSQFASRPFSPPISAGVPRPTQDAHNLQPSKESDNRFARISIYPTESEPQFAQPKLEIGSSGDKYEREADTVARKVVTEINSPQFRAPQIQSAIVGESAPPQSAFRAPQTQSAIVGESIQPKISILPKSTVQRVETEAPSELESGIGRSRGSGEPMEASVREPMEQAFGADFSGVRIHANSHSDRLNQSIQAKAFTTGQDIFFRQSEYNPHSWGGQELLAHELTHVVQQTGRVQPALATEEQSPNESIPSLQRKSAACEAEEKKEDEKIQRKSVSFSGERVQRSLFDVLSDAIDEVFDSSLDDNEMQAFPPCEDSPHSLPSLNHWLDNSALESIRHHNKVLSQSKSPSGDSKEATILVNQLLLSWGCDFYNQNFLPKFGVNSKFGAETKTAVKQFQSYFSLNVDGAIGSITLQAMDVYMGVARPSKPVTPSEIGGDEVQGKSRFNREKNPVAQIYFATNDFQLDSQDRGVLALLANALDGSESVSINFYGYSDKHEAVDYNLQLADFRTASVSSVFQSMLDERNVNDYDVLDIPLGEIERPQNGTTAEELKPFRRVDIEIQQLTWPEIDKPSVCTDLLCIPEKPSKPKDYKDDKPGVEYENIDVQDFEEDTIIPNIPEIPDIDFELIEAKEVLEILLASSPAFLAASFISIKGVVEEIDVAFSTIELFSELVESRTEPVDTSDFNEKAITLVDKQKRRIRTFFEQHHLLPQEKELKEWFAERLIDVDDFAVRLTWGDHSGIHTMGWNDFWKLFKNEFTDASKDEIMDFLSRMREAFKISNEPIIRYQSSKKRRQKK